MMSCSVSPHNIRAHVGVKELSTSGTGMTKLLFLILMEQLQGAFYSDMPSYIHV